MQASSFLKQPIAVSALPDMIQCSPIAMLFETSVGDCRPGFSEVRIPVTDKIRQHRGIVNGAVLGFVADTACCMAAATQSGDVRTQEYKINFIAPAMGEEIIGRGSVIGGSFTQIIARADLYARNESNEYLVATALATLFTL